MPTSYNSNTDLLLGNNVMVFISGSTATPLAFAQDCKLSITSASIDTTNKMSGNFKASLPGQISWNVTSSCLVSKVTGDTSFDALLATQLTGGTVNIVLGTPDPNFALTGAGMYTGVAHITSLDMDSKDNSICTSSVTFEGSGPLVHVVGS